MNSAIKNHFKSSDQVPLKQALKVTFSWKRNKAHPPDVILNDSPEKNIW